MVTETRRRRPGFFGGEARSRSSDTAVSVLRFLGPRYWRSWVLIAWLKLAAMLPTRLSLALHSRLGRWLGRRSSKSMQVVLDNLQVCFPELTEARRRQLATDYFGNMGAMIAELALAWFGSKQQLRRLFEFEGTENLERALAGGRGVVLCAGHFTTMEICLTGVSFATPRCAILYNKRRSQLLSEYQRRSRERFVEASYQKHDLRGMLRSLRANSVVWFSADEAHTGKSSALLPFFGEPALTNIALSRIAKISGAAVVPLSFCRKADDSGYRIRFGPALADFPGPDPIADTRLLVSLLEDQIRACPAQYFWKQKRFRGRNGDTPEAD